eukprot:2688851-Rhodomonas_salina.2
MPLQLERAQCDGGGEERASDTRQIRVRYASDTRQIRVRYAWLAVLLTSGWPHYTLNLVADPMAYSC